MDLGISIFLIFVLCVALKNFHLIKSGSSIICKLSTLLLRTLVVGRRQFDIFSPITGGCSEGLGAF